MNLKQGCGQGGAAPRKTGSSLVYSLQDTNLFSIFQLFAFLKINFPAYVSNGT